MTTNLHEFINKLPMELINKIYSYTLPNPTSLLIKEFIKEYSNPINDNPENDLIWVVEFSFADDYFHNMHDGLERKQPSKYYSIYSECYSDYQSYDKYDYLEELFYENTDTHQCKMCPGVLIPMREYYCRDCRNFIAEYYA